MRTFKGHIHCGIAILLLAASHGQAQVMTRSRADKSSALDPVPVEKLPRYGTFWSLQRTNSPPLPFFAPYLRDSKSPVYLLDRERNVFVVDDSAFDYAALDKEREEQKRLRRLEWELGLVSDEAYWAEEGGAPGPLAYSYGPEDFWIEITGVTNDYAYLTLHGTVSSNTDWYQLLNKTNLAQPGEWALGELRQGYPDTNQTVLQPVNVSGHTNLFFRGQHERGYVFIQNVQHAYESNAVFAAATGSVTIQAIFPGDVTVYYRVNGTASNGVDYTSLSGVLTIPSSTGLGTIEVQPVSDGLAEGEETVTITLVQTNGYLIAHNAQAAIVRINDLSTVVQLQADPDALSLIESNGPSGSPAVGTELLLYREDSRGLLPALTVPYSVTGTASNGVDFSPLTGTVTFDEFADFAYIQITPLSDSLVEGIETVKVTLLPTNTHAIDPSWASVDATIADSSTTVQVDRVRDAVEPDPANNIPSQAGVFLISRNDTRGASPALTVSYQMSGTASNSGDYTNLIGTVTIPADEAVAFIYVEPFSDNLFENSETVIIKLTSFSDEYLIATNAASATNTISDTTTTVWVSFGSHATEPNPASSVPGQTGYFLISRNDTRNPGLYPPLTVTYQMSGVASNGVDYSSLTGAVTFQTNQTTTNIFVQPLADTLIEGNETVRLTLTQTGDAYQISPGASNATILIVDNIATNLFVPVVANLASPAGIDYHALSNRLIVSINYSGGGTPSNFVCIYTNLVLSNTVVVATNVVITNWSGVQGIANEIKLVTVKTNLGGFTNSDMYFSSGNGIGWLSANGASSNLNWCFLTNSVQTNAQSIRGSLCLDQSGVFNNQLIAVTSDDLYQLNNKGVWRVDAQGHPTLVTNILTTHLEGVITLPNNTNQWGPWAGKIITGDENQNVIYVINTNGVVTPFDPATIIAGGMRVEDFEIIPPGQDLYGCDLFGSALVKLSRNYLTNYVGDLLITEAGEYGPAAEKFGKVFIVRWDSTIASFVAIRIPYFRRDGSNGLFEHVTFAPIDLPPLTP